MRRFTTRSTTSPGDLAWLHDVGLAARRETGTLQGCRWVLLGLSETSIHHDNRCLWRLVVFPGLGESKLFSIDLERDILGGFCMSLNSDEGWRVIARFELAPHYDEFRQRALSEAEALLSRRPDPVTSP